MTRFVIKMYTIMWTRRIHVKTPPLFYCQNDTFNKFFLLKRRYMYHMWCLVIQDLSSKFIQRFQNRRTCLTEGADFNKVRVLVNHRWTWCLTEIFQQKGPISFDLHRTGQHEDNIGIGYGSELIWQWKIDLSCPFTIHKHEINFSFRLIAVLFSN